MVAINNLSRKIARHRAGIEAAQTQVTDSGWFVLGQCGQRFEAAFAKYLDARHCIGLANGTDAIELGLKGLGVQRSCRVATVANAGMYTSTALMAIGAIPLYMDVEEDSRTASFATVERALATGAEAVVITHLYGRVAPDITRIAALCAKVGVPLLEDCAQAHGARLAGKMAGTFGDASSFSFYPTKNLGALGDGGALVTNRDDVAERVRRLRQYGWETKYTVAMAGARNSRLDEVHAATLTVFLPYLDEDNARRRAIAKQYSEGIKHPLVSAPRSSGEDYVGHLYVITSPERDALRMHLAGLGIGTDIHYPIPDYRQPVFGREHADVLLPVTELLTRNVLTLPCYPELSDAEVSDVINAVNWWRK